MSRKFLAIGRDYHGYGIWGIGAKRSLALANMYRNCGGKHRGYLCGIFDVHESAWVNQMGDIIQDSGHEPPKLLENHT